MPDIASVLLVTSILLVIAFVLLTVSLMRLRRTTRDLQLALAFAYDQREDRIGRIAADEDLARVRPDLDGNEIMKLLGLRPGPLVGQAWKFLKELRLDRGPLEHDEAVAELRKWAAEQGLPLPE